LIRIVPGTSSEEETGDSVNEQETVNEKTPGKQRKSGALQCVTLERNERKGLDCKMPD